MNFKVELAKEEAKLLTRLISFLLTVSHLFSWLRQRCFKNVTESLTNAFRFFYKSFTLTPKAFNLMFFWVCV
jgi:hypothetical protein